MSSSTHSAPTSRFPRLALTELVTVRHAPASAGLSASLPASLVQSRPP